MALMFFPRLVESNIGQRSGAELLKIPVEFSRYTANASSARIDLGRVVRMDSASSLTVTLNANGTDGSNNFLVGDTLVYVQWGVGAVGFAAGAGATLLSLNSLVSIEGKGAMVAAIYCEDNLWWLTGRLA
jgi:hypothetical protein